MFHIWRGTPGYEADTPSFTLQSCRSWYNCVVITLKGLFLASASDNFGAETRVSKSGTWTDGSSVARTSASSPSTPRHFFQERGANFLDPKCRVHHYSSRPPAHWTLFYFVKIFWRKSWRANRKSAIATNKNKERMEWFKASKFFLRTHFFANV